MKTVVLLFLIGTVAAGNIPKPDFSIGLNFDHDTTAGSLGAAVPRVRWDSEEMSVAGCFDVQGGIDSTLTNIRKPPQTYIWGEAKRILSNNAGAVAIRSDMNVNELEEIDLDLRVNGFHNTVGLRLLGSASAYSIQQQITAFSLVSLIVFSNRILLFHKDKILLHPLRTVSISFSRTTITILRSDCLIFPSFTSYFMTHDAKSHVYSDVRHLSF